MWSTKKAYLGEDTPFRGTHKFGTSIKPIVKNEGVSHPSPFTHKIYIFCCLLLYQMKENPLDYICASFQANQIINKWTMPPFVNFKKVEIFEPLLLRTKKTEIRLYVKPATINTNIICMKKKSTILHVSLSLWPLIDL